jgi:hypothetical protein
MFAMRENLDLPELHWLAGLLEGEGSFMPGPPSNPRMPCIAIAMNDQDVMARVGRLYERKVQVVKPRNARWQVTYQLRLQGANAVSLMTLLRPLMGSRRRAQIDHALACYDPRPTAVLTDETARAALDMLVRGHTVKAVAARLGVTIWCIYDLRLGRTFKHLSRNSAGTAAGSAAGSSEELRQGRVSPSPAANGNSKTSRSTPSSGDQSRAGARTKPRRA